MNWNKTLDELMDSKAGEIINDIKNTRLSIFISLLMGCVYSIAWIYMMSRCARCLAFMAIGLFNIIFIGSAGAFIYLSR